MTNHDNNRPFFYTWHRVPLMHSWELKAIRQGWPRPGTGRVRARMHVERGMVPADVTYVATVSIDSVTVRVALGHENPVVAADAALREARFQLMAHIIELDALIALPPNFVDPSTSPTGGTPSDQGGSR